MYIYIYTPHEGRVVSTFRAFHSPSPPPAGRRDSDMVADHQLYHNLYLLTSPLHNCHLSSETEYSW